jgi:hypothetical protein
VWTGAGRGVKISSCLKLIEKQQDFALKLGFADARSNWIDITGLRRPESKLRYFLQHIGIEIPQRATLDQLEDALYDRGIRVVDLNVVESRQTKLEDLNEVLAALGLRIASTISRARELLSTQYINIFDFSRGTPKDLGSLRDLRTYSWKNGLIFPLESAKKDSQTTWLLKRFYSR